MKKLEQALEQATQQWGIELKKSIVTYGTMILFFHNSSDMYKAKNTLSGMDAKVEAHEQDLTVSILF